MFIIVHLLESSGELLEECCLIKLPKELLLWEDLKFLKVYLLLMIPRKEKLYLTLSELLNLAASESSATWEIFQDKLAGEKELLFKLLRIKEEIELLPGIKSKSRVQTK